MISRKILMLDSYDYKILCRRKSLMLEASIPVLVHGYIFISVYKSGKIDFIAHLDEANNTEGTNKWYLSDLSPLSETLFYQDDRAHPTLWLDLDDIPYTFAIMSALAGRALTGHKRLKPSDYIQSNNGYRFLPKSKVDGWYIIGSKDKPRRLSDFSLALSLLKEERLGWWALDEAGQSVYCPADYFPDGRRNVISIGDKSLRSAKKRANSLFTVGNAI